MSITKSVRHARAALLVRGALVAVCGLAGCTPFRPLLDHDRSLDLDLIRRAGRSTDPRLDAPLLALLDERLAAPADDAAAARAQVAALALAERRTMSAVAKLAAFETDPDPQLRAASCEALALLGGAAAKAALERFANGDANPRVRDTAGSLLEGMRNRNRSESANGTGNGDRDR